MLSGLVLAIVMLLPSAGVAPRGGHPFGHIHIGPSHGPSSSGSHAGSSSHSYTGRGAAIRTFVGKARTYVVRLAPVVQSYLAHRQAMRRNQLTYRNGHPFMYVPGYGYFPYYLYGGGYYPYGYGPQANAPFPDYLGGGGSSVLSEIIIVLLVILIALAAVAVYLLLRRKPQAGAATAS